MKYTKKRKKITKSTDKKKIFLLLGVIAVIVFTTFLALSQNRSASYSRNTEARFIDNNSSSSESLINVTPTQKEIIINYYGTNPKYVQEIADTYITDPYNHKDIRIVLYNDLLPYPGTTREISIPRREGIDPMPIDSQVMLYFSDKKFPQPLVYHRICQKKQTSNY